MSYSVSGSGHGANSEKVKAAFGKFVAELDEATAETGTKFSGSVSGSEDSVPFSLTAEAARTASPEAE